MADPEGYHRQDWRRGRNLCRQRDGGQQYGAFALQLRHLLRGSGRPLHRRQFDSLRQRCRLRSQRCGRLLPGGTHRFLEDCKLYRGSLRPNVSDGQLVRMLRLEVGLLAGDVRPWSSDLLLGAGAPLIEVDPDRITDTLGTDGTRPLYRRGWWVGAGD